MAEAVAARDLGRPEEIRGEQLVEHRQGGRLLEPGRGRRLVELDRLSRDGRALRQLTGGGGSAAISCASAAATDCGVSAGESSAAPGPARRRDRQTASSWR